MGKYLILLGAALSVVGILSNLIVPMFSESTLGFAIMLPFILSGVLIIRYSQHKHWVFAWDRAFYAAILIPWIWMAVQQYFHLEQFGIFAMMTPYVDLIQVPAFMIVITAVIVLATIFHEVKPPIFEEPSESYWSKMESTMPPQMSATIRFLRIDQWLGAFLTSLWILVLTGIPLSAPFRMALGLVSLFTLYSFTFAINQLMDLDSDQKNTTKCDLPVASGKLTKNSARITTLILLLASVFMGWLISLEYLLLTLGFIFISICYSCPPFRFKARRFLDITAIAIGLGVFPVLLPWVLAQPIGIVPISLLAGVMLLNVSAHCFQMLGDIDADQAAGLNTSAVYLGNKGTTRLAIISLTMGLILLFFYSTFYTTLTAGWFKTRTILLFLTLGLLASPAIDFMNAKDKNKSIYRKIDKYTRRSIYLWIALLLIHCAVSTIA